MADEKVEYFAAPKLNYETFHDNEQENEPEKPPILVYLLTFMAAIGGFLFGYDTGVISGAILILSDLWNLSDFWQELIVSATIAAAAIFSALGGILNQKFGRKPVILGSSLFFILGSIIMAFCNSRGYLLLGRLTVGVAIGLSSGTIPAYVCEAAPVNIRGSLITMFQLMITFGFFVAGVANACFSYLSEEISWRLMLGIGGIPAVFQLFGFAFMPESPRWEATYGNPQKAKKILRKLNHTDEIADKEFHEIMQDHEETEKALKDLGGNNALKTMLKTPKFRRALVVGCSLQMFQQLSGINTVMYYSATIIEMAGIEGDTLELWITAGVYFVNFICTFVALYFVERMGRRHLLLASVGAVATCLALLGLGFLIMSLTSDRISFIEYDEKRTNFSCFDHITCDGCSYDENCGYCYDSESLSINNVNGSCLPVNTSDNSGALYGRCSIISEENEEAILRSPISSWKYGYCPTKYSWIPILGLLLYLCAFSSGFGPIPWILNAEIYPNWARSTGAACATSTNWTFNFIISLTFLSLASTITRQGAFFLYACLSTAGFVWFCMVVPETKNCSMENVEKLFERPWCSDKQCKSPMELLRPTRDKIGEIKKQKNYEKLSE